MFNQISLKIYALNMLIETIIPLILPALKEDYEWNVEVRQTKKETFLCCEVFTKDMYECVHYFSVAIDPTKSSFQYISEIEKKANAIRYVARDEYISDPCD